MTGTDDPSRLPGTHRSDYPNVAEWLDGVDSSHWWVRLLDTERDPAATPPTLADLVLGPLEILVQAVRGASPVRLGELVNRFRDPDPANLLSARLELLCAANMAIRHVPFEFGGRAEKRLAHGRVYLLAAVGLQQQFRPPGRGAPPERVSNDDFDAA